MGLREEKQERRRLAIIENAIALFREAGFAPVPVREISARCQISDATFFNYFDSKEAVLCEWGQCSVDAAFQQLAAATAERGLRSQLRELVRLLAARVDADVALMGEAWRRVRLVQTAARQRGLPAEPDAALVLIERARERGELRMDLPAEQLAELLRSAVVGTLAHWLAAERREPLAPRLQRALDLLLDGFRKRNERVAAVARAEAAPRI